MLKGNYRGEEGENFKSWLVVSLKSSLLVIKVARIFTCNTCMHTIICKNLVTTDTVILKICWKKDI